MAKGYILTNPGGSRKKRRKSKGGLKKKYIKAAKGDFKKAWKLQKAKKAKKKNPKKGSSVAKRKKAKRKSPKRVKAAKKAAATRKRKKAKRVAAGKKAARTRKRKKAKRKTAAKKARKKRPIRKSRKRKARRKKAKRNPVRKYRRKRKVAKKRKSRKRKKRNMGLFGGGKKRNPFKLKSLMKEAQKTLGWAFAGYVGHSLATTGQMLLTKDTGSVKGVLSRFGGAVLVGWLGSFVLPRETSRALMAGGLISAIGLAVDFADMKFAGSAIGQAKQKLNIAAAQLAVVDRVLPASIDQMVSSGVNEYMSPEGIAEYMSPEGMAYVR